MLSLFFYTTYMVYTTDRKVLTDEGTLPLRYIPNKHRITIFESGDRSIPESGT